MKQYFAYTRVSTVRQGEHGVSLQEQKSEIERYARQKGLSISEWFEERETAAKFGRTLFTQLMKRLRKGEADGVVIHKIDRSARNLRDWADIAQLVDDGVEVHFTRESVDMQSSSGRLSADVQAVVAANYIRNLREETIKGFYGRLKQGIYPLPAPLGYLNQGSGKPKTIDPVRGPLIKSAFELYASRTHSHQSLAVEMERRGLRTRGGLKVSKTTLADILKNSFYYGLISMRKNTQTFAGVHTPLITRELFNEVQDVLHGRAVRPMAEHRSFLFSRLLTCGSCGRSLIGERQKGHAYYRCHRRECAGSTVREEDVDQAFRLLLTRLRLRSDEMEELDLYLSERRSAALRIDTEGIAKVELRLGAIRERLTRLTDALLDGDIDRESFDERKKTLLEERLGCEAQLSDMRSNPQGRLHRLEKFVELVKSAYLLYEKGNREEKREIIQTALSNRTVHGKEFDFMLVSSLSAVAETGGAKSGGPLFKRERTFWESRLANLFCANL
jgi:DNA invertase Pin-like site-specific DNA recombinase